MEQRISWPGYNSVLCKLHFRNRLYKDLNNIFKIQGMEFHTVLLQFFHICKHHKEARRARLPRCYVGKAATRINLSSWKSDPVFVYRGNIAFHSAWQLIAVSPIMTHWLNKLFVCFIKTVMALIVEVNLLWIRWTGI